MGSFTPQNPFELRNQFPRVIFQHPDVFEVVPRILNPNEYGSEMKKGITACADRFGAALIYAGTTIMAIRSYRDGGFPENLAQINQEVPLPGNMFCELGCPSVRANFEALVFATKGLLDVLCKYLLSRKIGLGVDGFHKAKVNGNEVVGGRVLNVLRRSVSKSTLPTRDNLIDLIEHHKTAWIDDLVIMRDAVTHTSELQNVIGFWLIIEGGRSTPYTTTDIHSPILQLENRTEELDAYCRYLVGTIQDFVTGFRDALFTPEEREANLAKLHAK